MMLFQFDVKTENGKVHLFTNAGKDVKEAMNKIPVEMDKRGIFQDYEIIATRTYELGGKWINADGTLHEEPVKEEIVEEEPITLEEDEGQLSLAL
ncbi:hypothetical protein FLAPJACK_54 [Bacillus phage Flapjack]|uniref:Uncharacterized protein n=1 Tax=Bacillus phage Flapjack TaxID=1983465 RepID=A0A1X9SFY4_9CAUD|nr:hypothetical protein FLAPJACK_54 [Bacillus phage Flapjack]